MAQDPGGPIEVRVDSLESFRKALDRHERQAQAVIDRIDAVAANPPSFGGFPDGKSMLAAHDSVRSEFAQRAQVVLKAIHAAQQATDYITTNYRTADARNRAGAADVEGQLATVSQALGER